MKNYRIKILNGRKDELRIDAEQLHAVIGLLLEGTKRATRFTVEGQSTKRGAVPSWLHKAATFDITGLQSGSAQTLVEAAPLREACPQKFEPKGQTAIFHEEWLDFTGIDIFGRTMDSVLHDDVDEIEADRALLDTCVRFSQLSSETMEGIEIDGIAGRESTLSITGGATSKIEELLARTPPSQAARITGTLDTISASRSTIVLILNDGSKIRARFSDKDNDVLKAHFDKTVVVSGIAHYAPSGRLQSVDVENLEPARDSDAIFASAPLAQTAPFNLDTRVQDETSGVSAFFGTWPGDESDEQLLDAVESIE